MWGVTTRGDSRAGCGFSACWGGVGFDPVQATDGWAMLVPQRAWAAGHTACEELDVDSTARKKVLYSGHVQGVGFRYTARSIAGGFDVVGYVRNLPDGRVELVAEGSPAELQAFLDAVDQELGVYIRDVKISDEPPSGRFSDFSIRL